MNAGKKFEQAIKKSIDTDRVLYHRLSDSTGTFSGGEGLRFSVKNPCDAFLFDTKTRLLYTLELKSSKSKSFSFEDINCKDKQPTKMIHKHQIIGLKTFGEYDNVVSGFIFNFRDDVNNTQTTYFQSIQDFLTMTEQINKKSLNEKDLKAFNAYQIDGNKKRVNWTWNITKFLDDMEDKNG